MLAPRYLMFRPTNLFNFTIRGKLSIKLITYLIWFSSPQNWTPYWKARPTANHRPVRRPQPPIQPPSKDHRQLPDHPRVGQYRRPPASRRPFDRLVWLRRRFYKKEYRLYRKILHLDKKLSIFYKSNVKNEGWITKILYNLLCLSVYLSVIS